VGKWSRFVVMLYNLGVFGFIATALRTKAVFSERVTGWILLFTCVVVGFLVDHFTEKGGKK